MAEVRVDTWEEAFKVGYPVHKKPYTQILFLQDLDKLTKQLFVDRDAPVPKEMHGYHHFLWNTFYQHFDMLSEYTPESETHHFRLSTLFWIILARLKVHEHRWNPTSLADYYRNLNEPKDFGDVLPHLLQAEWLISTKRIAEFSIKEFLAQIYQVAFTWNDLSYHPSLEIFIEVLEHHAAFLSTSATDEPWMESDVYCVTIVKDAFDMHQLHAALHEEGENHEDRVQEVDATSVVVWKKPSFAFLDECARFFVDARDRFHQWREYPRHLPMTQPLTSPTFILELGILNTCDPLHYYPYPVIDDEQEPVFGRGTLWKQATWWPYIAVFVEKVIPTKLHARIMNQFIPWYMATLVRPGDALRAKDNAKGFAQKPFNILRIYRASSFMDYLDQLGQMEIEPWYQSNRASLIDDTAPWNPMMDAFFLFMFDQFCMHSETNLQFPFLKLCVVLDIKEQRNKMEQENKAPLIVRCFNHYDVFYGHVYYQTQNVVNALLLWIFLVLRNNCTWESNTGAKYNLHPILYLFQNPFPPAPKPAPRLVVAADIFI